MKINLKYYALPNYLLGKKIVPEYIQDEIDPKIISDKILEMLTTGYQTELYNNFLELKEELSENGDPIEHACSVILN